ncbi:energy transducer TonB family protein [Sorangium sp. So ce388]|uniref:energy transducer TonB family protein n=1 Tax=Sorangium sp. So ce388 TaxID=3133309 RepID=UPI003F5C8879
MLATLLFITASCSEVPPPGTPNDVRRRPRVEEWRAAQALAETYVPEVQAGNLVALGKTRVPFARYINSMHERLHPIYEEELAAGRKAHAELRGAADMAVWIEVVVNRADGRLARLGVVKSSGSVGFDVVALEAVLRAAPFDAPPPLLASPGGKVYLHWVLHTDPHEACSTRNARPFLLARAPSKVSAVDAPDAFLKPTSISHPECPRYAQIPACHGSSGPTDCAPPGDP